VEKTLDSLKEQRAKAPPLRIGTAEQVALQDPEEEILGKIFGVLLRVDAAGDKSEDGSPVNSAKLSQRLSGFLIAGLGVGGGENDAPAGGFEMARCFYKVCALARAH